MWTPTTNIITAGEIHKNFVTYALDPVQQREALTWAGGPTTKLIKTAQNSRVERDKPKYPLIAFVEDEDAQDAEDLITAVYPWTLEIQVNSSDPEVAVRDAKIYRKAMCSMIVNCPIAILIANTGATSGALLTMETKFERIKEHDTRKNDFRQDVTIRTTFELHGPANG